MTFSSTRTAMLRMIARALHSTYGPAADTGGLMQHHAPTIYAYNDLDALLHGGRRTKVDVARPRRQAGERTALDARRQT
jgi:hypothetical protein